MAQKKKSSWSSRFKRVSEGAEREYSAPLSKPVETPKGHTLKPGEALNISIPRGYFEAREAEKQNLAAKYQTNAGRTTAQQWQDLADHTQKRMTEVSKKAGTNNVVNLEVTKELDTLRKARDHARKAAENARKVEASEKYGSYYTKRDFETKAAEGAKQENNVVQYVKDNWEKITATGNVGPTVGNKAAKNAKLVYRNMTASEVKLYNYILATDGEEDANKYLDSIMDELNYREGSAQYERLSSNNDKAGIQGVGETIATGLYGLTAGGDQWKSGVEQMFSNELQPTSAQQYGSMMVQADLADTPGWNRVYQATVTVGNMLPSIILSQGIGGRAGMFGNAGTNAGKAILANVGKNVGAAAMGLGASGNAYAQAIKEGYSEEQARAYGVLVGASEALLERFLGGIGSLSGQSGEQLLKKMIGTDTAFKRFIGSFVGSNISEMFEETLQSYLEPAFATLLTGEEYDAPTAQEFWDTIFITLMSTTAIGGGRIYAETVGQDSEGNAIVSPAELVKYAAEQVKNKFKAPKQTKTADNSTVSPAASAEAQQVNVASNAVAASNPGRTVVDAATTLLMEKQGLDLKTATKRAEIIQKLVDGVDMKPADFIKMVNRLDPKNPTTQAIFTELTGVVFPENKGSVEVMYNTYRSAHEVAQQQVKVNQINAEAASLNVEAPVDEAAIPAEAQALHPGVPAIEDVQPGVTEFINEVNNNVGEEGQALRGFASFKEEMSKRDPNLVRGSDEMWERLYRQYLGDNETLEFRGQRFTHREFMSLDLRDEKGKVLSAEEKEARWAAEREFQQEKARKRERGLQLRLTEQQRYATVKWEKALKSYGVEVIWDDTMGRAPGSSDQRGAIYLNPRRLTTETAIAEIVAHELVHSIENVEVKAAMVEDIIETLHPKNKSLDEELDKEIKKYQRYYDEHGIDFTVTPEWIREEYAGDLMRATFTDETLRAKLAGEKPSIMRKILNVIDKFLDFVGDTDQRKEVSKIRERFAKALATNADATYRKPGDIYNEDGKLVVSSNDQGYSRLSLSTYEMEGREYLVNWMDTAVDKGDLTREDADAIIDSLDQIYDTCMEYKEKYGPFSEWSDAKVVTDANGNPVFSVVKPNGDYAMNLDFSLVCKKRRTLDAVLNELVKRGVADDLRMGQKDFVKINNIIRTYGFETACDLCFVDAKRFRQAEVADNFVKMYNDLVKSLAPKGSGITFDYFNFGGNTLVQNTGTGIDTVSDADLDFTQIDHVLETQKPDSGAGSVEYRIAKHLKATAADRKLLLRGDFISTAGFNTVNVTNPAVLKLFNAKKGSAGPKSAVSDVQYLNEILRSSTFNRDKAYRVGGVRVQSFSDYVPRMVFDYLQMFADLAAKKLPAHTYTKEELFVKQFGLTGIKINMSLIPRVVNNGVAAGLDADGNYAWAKESFDYNTAVDIQNAEGYSRNCGTIAVGVSDEHIRKMMADPEIRMIIPYHKSGLNPVVAKLNNIQTYTDYTLEQNTRRASTGKKLDPKVAADKKLLDAMPDFNTLLFEAGENGDPRAAVETYVRWCEENDLLPKFDKFCYKQIDGVFVEENGKKVIDENYYKLIEDFTVYDNGQYVPQQDITMTFPDENSAFGSMKDLIKRGLEEDAILEGDRKEKVPEIADKITEALGKKTKAPQKRMALNMAEDQDSAGFTLSEQQKKFFKNSKAVDSRGRLKLMFHGTEQFGFTIFDPAKSDDRRSLFFTDSIPVARTYTPNKEAGLRLVPTNFDPSIAEEKDFRYTPESKKEAAEYLQKLGWETEGKKLTKKEIETASLNYARQTAREFRNWYDALEDTVDAPMFVKWLQTQSRASSVIAEAIEATRGTDATAAMWAVRKAVREMNFVKARAEELLGWSLDEDQFEGVMTMLEALEDHQFAVRHYIGALQTEGPVVEYNAPMYGNIPMSDESIVTDASEENNRIRTGVYMVHLNLENPLIIDANFHTWEELEYDDVYADNADGFSNETRWEGETTREIAEWAEEHGYDGVIFRNLIDIAGLSELDNYDEDAPSTVMIAFKPEQVKSAANKEPTKNPDIRYALVEDPAKIEELENQEHLTVYKAMVKIGDNYYPPMASEEYVDEEYTDKKGNKKTRSVRKLKNPSILGRWQESVENPAAAEKTYDPDKGYSMFKLLKSNKDDIPAAYNPYEHTSSIVLNDQFTTAYKRPELVTVEYRIPVSELTSGYKAQYAKDPVGLTDWKAGGVAQKLQNTHRDVYLTRWSKPVRELSDAEVAQKYKEIMDKEPEVIKIPWNVVTESLRHELENAGVAIDYSDASIGSVVYKFEDVFPADYAKLPDSVKQEAAAESDRKAEERRIKAEKKAAKKAKSKGTRYALDSDYMAAVESGDMETAQKMVDEAAEAAFSESEVRNYNSKKLFKVYHATGAQFTVFDKKRFGASNGSAFGEGFYFTDDEWLAKSYGQKLGSYYLNIKNPFWYDSWQPEDLASMLERSGYEFDREYLMERADSVAFLESDLLDYVLPVIVKGGKFTSRELSQMLRDAGYDGVFAGEEFIAFEPEQIKSADPVTYDDAGNVIPLSERFNPKNPDIRYALSDDVKKEYSEKYGVENPSEKELMRHIERLEQEKLDAELERAAAETLRKLREEDQLAFKQKLSDQKMLDEMYYRRIGGKQLQKAEQKLDDAKARRARDIEDLNDKNLGTEMGYKREMREQKREMKAKADARVQAERQKRLDAIALQRTIAKAEKAAQHQRDEMVLGRRIAELQRKAATNLKVTTDAYRDRMSKLREKSKERTENLKQYYKLRSNAAKAVLRDKAKADAKRAEIEKEQGLVDTLRKAPAQRSFYEKKQDAISKLKSALRTAQFELENMANEIDRFAKRQVSPVTAGDLVTLLGGTTSTVEQIFKTALLDRTGNRLKVNGKELGSMKDVFLCLDSKGKVQENMQALLQDYMLHMHNQDRMSFVARAEAALTKFEEEHPYIASLTSDSLALLVTQTDKQTEELNNEPMVTAARAYAALLKERVKAKDKAVFGDDKGNDVTAEFSKQRCEEILAQAPWVAEKAEGIYEWWDAFMRAWAVGDSLSLEQYEHMRELYPHYVPTYRKDHGGIGSPNYVGATSAKPGEATRAAKGSHAEIVNIEDTFTTMVAKIVKLARTNELYKNILDTAMLDDNGTFADMISFNWDWQTGDYGKALEEGAFFNGDLDHHIDTNVGTEVTKEPIPNSNKFKYTLYAWYNGTKFSAEISPELYRSIAAVSGQLDNEWFKAAVAAGNFLTSPMKTFITGKNPAFALRNTMRDFSTAMVNTRVVNSVSGLAYPQYWARAVDEMRKHSDHWNNFVALGGTHGTQYRDAVTPSKALYKEKNWAGQAWDAVGKFNEVTESVTRFAEYLATVDRLGDTYENRIKGIKNAAEITVDFSRKGRTGKLINAWVPYWNPAVQGISKQIRSLVESPDGSAIMKQALKIGGRVVAQQVLLEGVLRAILKFKDRDDEWEKLDDRTKDAYYCIPLKDEHKFLKIPKSREWSAILGNNLWRILESANGRADAWDNYVETSLEASYLPPAIFRIDRETGGYETDFFPLSLFNDLMTNKDFAGRTIVPTALKNGTPEMQYDSDTSMLSRALGDLINFSPMQIDYIIGDYFGDFGKLFVMATAPGTWSGDRTFLQTTYDILISPWVKDNRYSNYDTGAYYDRLEELDKVVQDKKNHEGKDAAEQSLEYQVQQALKSRYGNDIDALNKQARELPDGPEKDDVKQRLADLIAEAIEYHDRALAGEIDKPILDARYAKCSDRVSNELIRLDSYSETYQFKPIDSAPKKLVDPDDNEREFVFTDEQKDKYLEIYYEFYNEYVDDAMSESWYRNSDGEEQAGLVLDAKKEAATDAKEAFFDWLEKQGVRSTPRKKVYR